MKLGRILYPLFVALLPAISPASELTSRQKASLSPILVEAFAGATVDSLYDVLVSTAVDPGARHRIGQAAAAAADVAARGRDVESILRHDAQRHQVNLAAMVSDLKDSRVAIVHRFWITDAVHIRADRGTILKLAERNDVQAIMPNPAIELLQPVSIADASSAFVGAQDNLAAVGARALWARGLTGKGRLVASIDTGVEGTHPALADRWRGRRGDTTSAWFDPRQAPAPTDNNGHGTHVMGIMVGRDGADTIGLAPDAEWITAGVVDRGSSLSATFADILAAMEWVVDPDGNPSTTDDVPDVVCNSWGVSQKIISACDSVFFDAIDHVEAMGIVCVFAAGNEGPFSMTMRNPADRAVTPTADFAVGAVDATSADLTVPPFSSRGPSACDGRSIKPELVAPGVSIRSSYRGQTYKLISGTSMSAPHVAAAVAILRQYNPNLTPEQIKTALMATARDIPPAGEDNASGHGMLDLEAALAALPPPPGARLQVAFVRPDEAGDGILSPGEKAGLAVTLSDAVVDARSVRGVLTALTSGVTTDADTVNFGDVRVGQAVDNLASPFMVSLPSNLHPGDSVWFELHLSGSSVPQGSVDTIGIMCGLPPDAAVYTVGDATTRLSLSNFGLLGLGPGSSLDAGGAGWQSPLVSGDLLYEAALIIGSDDGGLSDASRRVTGPPRFDFQPEGRPAGINAASGMAGVAYDDERAATPVGVSVSQTALYFAGGEGYDYITTVWTIHNRTTRPILAARVGWLIDIDLPGAGSVMERCSVDEGSGGVYHMTETGSCAVGVTPLGAPFAARRFYANPVGGKSALTDGEKRTALQSGSTAAPTSFGDYFEVLAMPASTIPPADSVTFALAFITARSAREFAAAASDARDRWRQNHDGAEEGHHLAVPVNFRLDQNYPNPFNAQTTIPVDIAATGSQVRLDIVDILGRRVCTLVDGPLSPGRHLITWDGTDDHGHTASSGVYFSRLIVGNSPGQVRRMLLLK